MPKQLGLSAMQRIQVMNDRLRRDKWWTKETLFYEVNRYLETARDKPAAESTLRGDLETIKEKAGDDLLCEMRLSGGAKRKKCHYRYANPDFSYFGAPALEAGECAVIHQAIELLGQIKADEAADQLKEIIQKLQYSYESPAIPRIIFEQPDVQGIALMQQLYEAIRDKQVIGFRYQPFDQKEPQDFMMHPYVLKEFNKRWYLVGLAEPQKEIWVCAFDRFKSDPKIKSLSYIEPAHVLFEPVNYFRNVIGPTVRKEFPVEEMALKFKPNRVPYIITKPLHHSQQLLKTFKDGGAAFSYHLRFNRELLALILSFGEDVTVVSPATLAERVKQSIQNMMALYSHK